MQKLNYKIIIVFGLIILFVVAAVLLIPKNKNQAENQSQNAQKDTQQTALEEVGIKTQSTSKVFSYINPFEKPGLIEYLAPKDDTIAANQGVKLSERTLLVRSLDVAANTSSIGTAEIVKPVKVVWGENGSIAYMSSDKKGILLGKDSPKPIEISQNITDIALSDKSGLVAIISGEKVSIFSIDSPAAEIASFQATPGVNHTVATADGIIFKSSSGWESYTKKPAGKKRLNAQGDIVGQYSSGETIILGGTSSSIVYNYKSETNVAVEGNINPAITLTKGNGTLFTGIFPGQSEDRSVVYCLNDQTNELIKLYESSSDLNSFEMSSATLNEDMLYFTWGFDLNSLKIESKLLSKCTK